MNRYIELILNNSDLLFDADDSGKSEHFSFTSVL